MTASPGRSELMPRQVTPPWLAPSPWKAMLRQRGVRRRLLAIAALTAIFLTVLLMCLESITAQRAPSSKLNLTDLLQPMRVPANLPGGPQSVSNPVPDETASLQGEEAVTQNARMPFAALGPAAQPFRFAGAAPERLKARACLAAAMVYEAGNDGIGQLAVGQVILNRVRHPAYPANVCGVVTQGSDRATGCQFTFTCDGSLARNIGLAVRTRAFTHADLMLDGMVFAGVGLATHYHTDGVYPWWSPRLEKIARVGPHLFFRWPGYWGSPRVFLTKRQGGEASAALFTEFAPMPADVNLAAHTGEAAIVSSLTEDAPAASASMIGHVPRTVQIEKSVGAERAPTIPQSRRLSSLGVPQQARESPMSAAPALQGVRLLRMFPEEGLFYLQLVQGSTIASRKRAAEQLCGGRSECQVYGWWSADAAPGVAQLDPSSRAAIAFNFVRRQSADTQSRPPSAMAM